MRRPRWILGISLTIVLIGSAAQAAGAATSFGEGRAGVPPGGDRVYKGKTSQGYRIEFHTNRRGGGWGLAELELGGVLRCQSGDKIFFGVGESWFPPMPPGEENQLSIDEVDPYEGLHLRGRLGPKGGSGTIEVTIPALTPDEQPQTCGTKERTWTVKRRTPPLSTVRELAPVSSSGQTPTLIMTARLGKGSPEVTRSWASASRRSANPLSRRAYSGTTSQDKRVAFRTLRSNGPWRLAEAQFEFGVHCQDGTAYRSASGWEWGGRGGP